MEPAPSVTVKVQLRPADLWSPFMWSWTSLYRWTVSFVLVYAVYDLFLRPTSSVREFRDWQSIVAIIMTLTVFIVVGLLVFPLLRTYALYKRNPAFREIVEVTFTPTGIYSRTENGESTSKWATFLKIRETRTHFFLYQTTYHASYFPKRCFSSRDQILELRKLISENFKGKWTLRRD